ncbi:aminoglycoside phosphotransferase family protein [Kordiimonas pumila]|uniref:Aminoglycoside phosphotransferase family protein n=1 Tax=Kordiimonas pumila TaxID=2161677 RepID=A0ABV7DAH1_9PROT|nr:phosphotransferase [Kordiimonas pumila]
MIARLEQQHIFATESGWGEADIHPLPSDASFRTYSRLQMGTEKCLLMDAPPEHENLSAYLTVQAHLERLGLRAPRVYASDIKRGFALIEDFGTDTFTQLLATGHAAMPLYMQAVDVLVHLHAMGGGADLDVPPYDMAVYLREVNLFTEWFIPAVYGREVTAAEQTRWQEAWQAVLAPLASDRSSLVLRDYHVDNLMIIKAAKGISACGLLDFQDALIGSKAYDLVSLLEDARLDVPDTIREAALERFFAGCPDIPRSPFLRDMDILGAQRHAKVAGIFVRLSRRDGKHTYLKHIPRVLHLLNRCLARAEMLPVRTVLADIAPDFAKKTVLKP